MPESRACLQRHQPPPGHHATGYRTRFVRRLTTSAQPGGRPRACVPVVGLIPRPPRKLARCRLFVCRRDRGRARPAVRTTATPARFFSQPERHGAPTRRVLARKISLPAAFRRENRLEWRMPGPRAEPPPDQQRLPRAASPLPRSLPTSIEGRYQGHAPLLVRPSRRQLSIISGSVI